VDVETGGATRAEVEPFITDADSVEGLFIVECGWRRLGLL